MPYPNPFLLDFAPVFSGILREKRIAPAKLTLYVIDEEPGDGIFEPMDVCGVLMQVAEQIRFLQVYTNRPAYFDGFAETMYEENGLLTVLEPKAKLNRKLRRPNRAGDNVECVLLDFEWSGGCCGFGQDILYIPVHKKPWELRENLDIVVPIGYNTVIVKRVGTAKKMQQKDRFELDFYGTKA